MPAPAAIVDLVARFRAHVDSYKRDAYNETLTRIEFINPFFKALGWDVDNERGYAEAVSYTHLDVYKRQVSS